MKKEDAVIESLTFWILIMLLMVIVYYLFYSLISILVNIKETDIPSSLSFFVKHSTFLKLICSMISYMLYIILVRVIIKCKIKYRQKKKVPFNMVACKFDIYASLITLLFHSLYMPGMNTGYDIDFAGYVLAIIFGFIFGENILFKGIRESLKEIIKRLETLRDSIKSNIKEFLPSFLICGLFVLVTILDSNFPYWPFVFIAGALVIIICLFMWYKWIPKLRQRIK